MSEFRYATATWQEQVQRVATAIRLRVFSFVMQNGGGYLSQACSAAELFATLYLKVMRLGPSTAPLIPPPYAGPPGPQNPDYATGAGYNGPQGPEYDRFIFSPSHYALVQYATLVEVGRMAEAGLYQFNKDGSTVEMIGAEHSPGGEVTSGSLGQALSQAGGIAMARRRKGEAGRVWVFMTDGEFQEGQVWEAVQALSHYRLDNLGVYVDVNAQQCDGAMSTVMTTEPLLAKLTAFGARAIEVDGHDVAALAAPAELKPDGRPLFVLSRSDPCRGIPKLKERKPALHYLRFKSTQEQQEYQAVLVQMLSEHQLNSATKPTKQKANLGMQIRNDTNTIVNSGEIIPQGVGMYFQITPAVVNGDMVRMEVELRKLPASFTGNANYVSYYVTEGTTATTVTVTGLTAGSYGWRYRLVGKQLGANPWVSDAVPYFVVQPAVDQPPNCSASAQQVRSDIGINLTTGAKIPQGAGIMFQAVPIAAPGDMVRLEVELCRLPGKFTGTPNYVSYYVHSGVQANTVVVTGLTAGDYGWRYRVVNNRGVTGAWSNENNPDFMVEPSHSS